MKATIAQTVGLEVQANGMKVTSLKGRRKDISNINLTDKCVHIFFEDGSHLFIRDSSDSFNFLKFEAMGGTPS